MKSYNHVGFTGTRKGFCSNKQKNTLIWVSGLLMKGSEGIAHHGDCLGGDEEFHYIIRSFKEDYKIHIHPPINDKDRAFCVGDYFYPEKEYLDRNKDIVDCCKYLIALSGDNEEVLRSGTWSTVRYARKKNKRISIIYPNGDIVDENF